MLLQFVLRLEYIKQGGKKTLNIKVLAFGLFLHYWKRSAIAHFSDLLLDFLILGT